MDLPLMRVKATRKRHSIEFYPKNVTQNVPFTFFLFFPKTKTVFKLGDSTPY